MQVCGVLRQLSRVYALAGNLGQAALALDQCLQAEILQYGTSSRRAEASRLRLQEIIQLSVTLDSLLRTIVSVKFLYRCSLLKGENA